MRDVRNQGGSRRTDGPHDVLEGPFGYFRLGETSGGVARDSSPYGNDAANFTPPAWVVSTAPLPGVAPEHDLTLRAARALKSACGIGQGVSITLDKKLPIGGGLGGGSSDAATTLIALNHLLRYSGINTAEAFNERLIGRMKQAAAGNVRDYLQEDDE